MRERQWRSRIWAARLGLLALALNALVPIHLAFDLAEAFEPAQQCGAHAEVDGAERRLLALLSGHLKRTARPTSTANITRARCAARSAPWPALPRPRSIALSALSPVGLPTAHSVIQAERVGAPAAYRSRAPPVA